MRLVRSLFIVLCLVGLPVLYGCGNPCGNLWKRLDRCAKSDADRKISRSKNIQKAFLARCKKSDKSRVKQCLKLKDCQKIRDCATRIRKKYK